MNLDKELEKALLCPLDRWHPLLLSGRQLPMCATGHAGSPHSLGHSVAEPVYFLGGGAMNSVYVYNAKDRLYMNISLHPLPHTQPHTHHLHTHTHTHIYIYITLTLSGVEFMLEVSLLELLFLRQLLLNTNILRWTPPRARKRMPVLLL